MTGPIKMMKRTVARHTKISIALLLAALALGQTATATADNTSGVPVPPEPAFKKGNAVTYGTQIANYVEKYDSGWVDSYAKSSITNVNARGEKMVSNVNQLTLEQAGGNRGLVRYLSPANVQGVAALTHQDHDGTDESWLYLPSNRRVRRISGANRTASFQGTEFTYEDLNTLVASRYEWKFVKASKSKAGTILEVQAKPTDKNSGYSKLHFHFNQSGWRPERIDYYDKAGRLLKVLTLSQWKHHHGRFWRPRKFEMHNKQTQKRSIFGVSSMFVTISKYKKKDGSTRAGLKESAFTRRALESR